MSTPGSVRIVAPLAGIDPAATDGDLLIYDGVTATWVRDPNTRVELADVQDRVDALEAEAGGALKGYAQTARTGVVFGPCDNSGTWTLCPTEYRVTVAADIGDVVQWLPSVMVNVGSDSEHDLAAVVGGSAVRYASSGTGTQFPNGLARMYLAPAGFARSWPVIVWQVQSGDLDGDGNLTLAVMYRAGSGNSVGNALYPNSTVTALNWGPVTAPGDDLTGRVIALEDALGAAGGIATLDGTSHVPIAQLPLGATSSTVVVGNDTRLSDARTPTAHAASHASGGGDPVSPASIGALATSARGAAGGVASLDGSTTVPFAQLPTGTSGTTVAVGNDSRFTDARTPTAHAASHASGGGDPVSPASIGALATTARGIANGVAPLDSGILVPIAYLPVGSSGTTVAAGNDARLSDARTPTAHAASHASGGGDPLTPAAIIGGSPASGNVLAYSGSAWVPSTRLSTAESTLTALAAQVPPHPTDLGMYGDAVSSVERARTTNSTSLSNGFYTLGMIVIPKSLTGITKVRFFLSGAGVAGAGTAVSVSIYSGSNPASLTRVATAPVTQASFTSTGLKEFTLSATIALTAGERLAWMSYIPASGYTTSPNLGCTQVTYASLINAGANYSAYKAAAVAAPSTLDTTSGWTTDSNLPWWSLL